MERFLWLTRFRELKRRLQTRGLLHIANTKLRLGSWNHTNAAAHKTPSLFPKVMLRRASRRAGWTVILTQSGHGRARPKAARDLYFKAEGTS
jgi:hypothetical protein